MRNPGNRHEMTSAVPEYLNRAVYAFPVPELFRGSDRMSENYENPDHMPDNETPIEHTGTDPSSGEPRGAYYSEYDEYRFRTPEGYPPDPRYPREPEKNHTDGLLVFFAVLGIVAAIAVATVFLYAGLNRISVRDTVQGFFQSQPKRQPEQNIVFGRQADDGSESSAPSEAAAGENAETAEGSAGKALTEAEDPEKGPASGAQDAESQPGEDRTEGVQGAESQPGEDRTEGVQDAESQSGEERTEGAQGTESQPAESRTKGAQREEDLSIPEIVKESMPSMVSITNMKVNEYLDFFGTTKQYEGTSTGSGIIVGKSDTDLLIVTNDHVISHSSDITVTFSDDTSLEGEVKGRDADHDLAIIGIPFSRIPGKTQDAISIIAIGDSDELAVGESVVAIGNALGYGQTVSAGIISAVNCTIKDADGNLYNLIQTDASINPGNSGGALLNMRGELIGINESKYVGTLVEGVGYAIPMAEAMPALERIGLRMSRSQVNDENASYLGITCVSVPKEYLIEGYPEGVYILEIEKGGPAEQGGLLRGDIIVSLGGVPVPTQEDLIEELTYYAAGEAVPVSVNRLNEKTGKFEKVSLGITLGNRADMTIQLPKTDSGSEETVSEPSEASSSVQPSSEQEETVPETNAEAGSEKAASEPGSSETRLTISAESGETEAEAPDSGKKGIPGANYGNQGQS